MQKKTVFLGEPMGLTKLKKLYLVTGGTGHLGTNLVSLLLKQQETVRVLSLEKEKDLIPEGAECVIGDITKQETLAPFFERDGYDEVALFHCAGIVTISSTDSPIVYDVNVRGCENVLKKTVETGVDRMVYVSSSHVIPDDPGQSALTEVSRFCPEKLKGQYAVTKAIASNLVLDYAAKGLHASIVHPTSLIGPGDQMGRNPMVRSISALASGRIPISVKGGYDFVDARDAAAGILQCEAYGRSGECYILSGHHLSVTQLINKFRSYKGLKPVRLEVPGSLALAASYPAEWLLRMLGNPNPVFTPTSIETLSGNGHYSHAKAEKELGYHVRDIDESLRATLNP